MFNTILNKKLSKNLINCGKIFTIMCIIILLIGCNNVDKENNKSATIAKPSSLNYKYKLNIYTKEDLAIYDTQTKNKIYLGMLKDEVEKIIGFPLEKSNTIQEKEMFVRTVTYSDGYDCKMTLTYLNDKLVKILLRGNKKGGKSDKRFVNFRGIGIGSPKEEIPKKYGNIKFELISDTWGSYSQFLYRQEDKFSIASGSEVFRQSIKPNSERLYKKENTFALLFYIRGTDGEVFEMHVGEYSAIYR